MAASGWQEGVQTKMKPDETPPRAGTVESPICHYPEAPWRCLEYRELEGCSADEFQEMLQSGWRRFGRQAFHTTCAACRICNSLRVDVRGFQPNRSQRRVRRLNQGVVRHEIGQPSLTPERFRLYRRFHHDRTATKGWPEFEDSPLNYAMAFLDNPFPTWEWSYWIGERLVGIGLVDRLRSAMSAIYCYHDPDERRRSLGTWNVLCLIQHAREIGIPHVYLGFHVPGSGSLAYKSSYRPNQILDHDRGWVEFEG